MARYQTTAPFYVNGEYHDADVRNPLPFELADDVEPSRKWIPLDKAAQEALRRLGVERAIPSAQAAAAAPAESDQVALSEAGSNVRRAADQPPAAKGKRAADQSPV